MSSINVTIAALPQSTFTACWIEINRPQRANAMDLEAFDSFNAALQSASNDGDVDAVIIAASGLRHFCAGADLSNRKGEQDALRLRKTLGNTLSALFGFPKPTIGAVGGVAVGAGAMLALALDRAVIAQETYLSMPEIDIGIAPMLPLELLTEFVGMAVAREIVLTSKRIDARTCVATGLMAMAVAPDQVRASAEGLAVELCKKPRETYAAFKQHLGNRMRAIINNTLGIQD